jgi:hypothetical protein
VFQRGDGDLGDDLLRRRCSCNLNYEDSCDGKTRIDDCFDDDWNVILRTIVPLIDQQDFPLEAMNESGLGDIVASQFFSPKAPTARWEYWSKPRKSQLDSEKEHPLYQGEKPMVD